MQLEIGDRLAPLIGAAPGEVIISDSTSVNVYKLATAALTARPGRATIVTDSTNFPTDVYVLRGVAEAHGATLAIIPIEAGPDLAVGLEDALDENVALVSLSHTTFKTGFTHDLARVTAMVHEIGALVLWDLSHSVGVVPVDLESAGADLAVGCTYKYLNGGPGAPAFLYVRRGLQGSLANPITGWWGHADPFAFDLDFRPADGIRKFHTGTMPVLSLATIDAGLADVADAGIDRLRAKSVSLTEFFIDQWEEHLEDLGFGLETARSRDPGITCLLVPPRRLADRPSRHRDREGDSRLPGPRQSQIRTRSPLQQPSGRAHCHTTDQVDRRERSARRFRGEEREGHLRAGHPEGQDPVGDTGLEPVTSRVRRALAN